MCCSMACVAFAWAAWINPTNFPFFSLACRPTCAPFSYPEPFLRAVNGARRGALAKSISNWHLIGYNEGYCSNTGYILLPCFHGILLWIWPEPLVAPRVRRALGTRMRAHVNKPKRLGTRQHRGKTSAHASTLPVIVLRT